MRRASTTWVDQFDTLGIGRNVAIATSNMFRANHPALKRLPVDIWTAHRPVGIITLKNRTLSPVAQLFIDRARKVAKSLARHRA